MDINISKTIITIAIVVVGLAIIGLNIYFNAIKNKSIYSHFTFWLLQLISFIWIIFIAFLTYNF